MICQHPYTFPPLERPFLSIVVPAYNEEARIGACIDRMRQSLPDLVPSWELLVADDGSRDRTREVVAERAAAEPRIRLLELPHRGKGEAVRRGLLEARGEWRYIADADLATPPDNLPRFLAYTKDPETALVIGSREAEGASEAGGILRPIFEPGDAMFFDHLYLHQTASDPSMPNRRYAVESWFFGPSAFPGDYIPLAY